MKIASLAVAALMSIFIAARAGTGEAPRPADDAVAADNAFASDIYAQLRQEKGNICISPYSISSALDMVSAGAEDETASQMLSVLHWSEDRSKLPAAAFALSAAILDQKDEHAFATIQIANALFGQKQYPYRKDFLDLLSRKYDAALETVDFVNHPADALDQINHWTAQKTAGRIKDVLPPSAVTPATRLVLVNAVYFKGRWSEAFKKAATADQAFYGDAKDPLKIPMMHERGDFNLAEDQTIQAVELPYVGDFSMVSFLPRNRDGLPALEESLTAQKIQTWIAALQQQPVIVSLPRFRMDCDYSLNAPLARLGMRDAFDPHRADFSGIASLERLKIDVVQHKTFISVDEEGTEAAAVTGVSVGLASVTPVRHFTVFQADHPFLFLIRHRSTGAILFVGRVVNPQ